MNWPGGNGIYLTLRDESGPQAVVTLVWIEGAHIPANILSNAAALDGVFNTAVPVPATSDFASDKDMPLTGFASLISIGEDDVAVGFDNGVVNLQLEDGNDSYLAAGGNDEVYGGAGNDSLSGQDGRDTLYGDDGNDVITGGLENDTQYGGIGNDVLNGDEFFDDLYGGIGDDRLYGGEDGDDVYGDDGNDQLFGGNGSDTRLNGGLGNDSIRGGAGADRLVGSHGRDTLNGDAGTDDLTGGALADRFIFSAGMGRDLIRDFEFAEGDRMSVARALVGGQTGLTTAQVFNQYGSDLGDALRFDFGNGNQITLLGVASLAELGNAITHI